MDNKYSHIFEPIQINSLRFKNRVMIAPIGGGSLDTFQELGRSGAASCNIGSCQIDNEWSMLMGNPDPFAKIKGFNAQENPKGGKILRDRLLAIKQAGMIAEVELMHAGKYAHNYEDKSKEGKAIGANTEAYMHKKGYMIEVTGMDKEMIEHVANNYATAAVKYLNFGFDMIMLHFAHGWLPWQFLSPSFNHRTDEFGGSFENRIKFPKMIVDKVRAAVGPDIPIELRIGATDYLDNCIPFDEVIKFVQIVEDKIDLVNVSSGLDSEPSMICKSDSSNLSPHCSKLHWAAEMKKHVNIPVAAVGNFITPDEVENAIASGKCDMVEMAQEFLVDPQWVNKVYDGRAEDVMPCMRCAICQGNHGVGCAANPRYHKYSMIPEEIPKAKNPRKVVIVGGGPAGLRAAIFADEAGHDVTLLEKESSLGGIIKDFYKDDLKVDLVNYHKYLMAQIKKHNNIKIITNLKVTPDIAKQYNPDVLIIAIGGEEVIPSIEGIENTISTMDAFRNPESIKGDVAIIGGGSSACELGIFLATKGHKIDMLCRSTYLKNYNDQVNWRLVFEYKIKQYPYTIHEQTTINKIGSDYVEIEKDGKVTTLHADTIINAAGYKPNKAFVDSFLDVCYQTYIIGDCYRCRTIAEATNEAYARVINIR